MRVALCKCLCIGTMTVSRFAAAVDISVRQGDDEYLFDCYISDDSDDSYFELHERLKDDVGRVQDMTIVVGKAGAELRDEARRVSVACFDLSLSSTNQLVKCGQIGEQGRWQGRCRQNGGSSVVVSGKTLQEIVGKCKVFSVWCRRIALGMKTSLGVSYVLKRYRLERDAVPVRYDDVVGSPRLYSGIKVSFWASLELVPVYWHDPILFPTQKGKLPLPMMVVDPLLSFESAQGCQVSSITGNVVLATGRVFFDPYVGSVKIMQCNLSTRGWQTGIGDMPNSNRVSPYMEYISPCNEFRLRVRKGDDVRHMAYVGGILSFIDEIGDHHVLTYIQPPMDIIKIVENTTTGKINSLVARLRRLERCLGIKENDGLCVARRFSAVPELVLDADKDKEAAALVDDICNDWGY